MTVDRGPRLLAISWEMPPLSGPRAMQVSRTLAALARRGWPSTVIAVAPRDDGPLLRDAAGAPPFDADGVEVVRVPSREESFVYRAAFNIAPALAHKPDRQRVWIDAAARAASDRLSRGGYERLMTFAQPWSDHLVGLRLRRDHRLPWIAHFSDPWVDSPYLPASAPARRFAGRMEAEVVRQADALVFVTQETADAVMSRYSDALRGKAHVVPHGYDRSLEDSTRAPGERRTRMRMVYTGRFYDGLRTPDAFFAALEALSRTRSLASELEVVLIGPEMARYVDALRAHGLEEIVSLVQRIPYAEAARAAAEADVLLVVDAASPGRSLFLPSKLVEYLRWRTPILGITPPAGASASLLRRLGCPSAAPDHPGQIAERIAALLDRWHAGSLDVSPSFASVAAEFDIDRTSASLAAILDRCQ